jgi:hypothetical protein
VQKMDKKAPATQSHPRVPPSGARSDLSSSGLADGTFSFVDASLMLVSIMEDSIDDEDGSRKQSVDVNLISLL